MSEPIRIAGARVHNLKNISLSLPKNKIVVVTGVSGMERALWYLTPSVLKQEGN